MAVEPGLANAVDPGEKRGENIAGAARRGTLSVGRGNGRRGRGRARRIRGRGLLHGLLPLLLRGAQQRRGGGRRHRRTRDRMLVGAGKDGDAAVLLDAHGHFRTDEIETFGAQMAAEQAHAGDAHLGLRRARHHGAVGIAHHDVADAHRGAAALGMLDLGAADHDVMMAAEILFDGGCEPGGHDVELDRSARKPPPERETAEDRYADEDADPDRGALEQTAVEEEEPAVEGLGRDRVFLLNLGAVNGNDFRRPPQLDDRPSRKRRALPLVRHAPSGVPSSAVL